MIISKEVNRMNFEFKVNVNDQDYLEYNVFWMIRSPYGKKQLKDMRIMMTVLVGLLIFVSLFSSKFSAESFLGIIPMLLVLFLAQIFLTKCFAWSLKWMVRALKKSGKMGYSPESVIAFSDDYFVETTPENKTENKYSVIERVSIVDNKMIYIHINNVMAYILPLSCFESKEQYDTFLDFLKTKCAHIDRY